MIGNVNVNLVERELEGSVYRFVSETNSHPRGNSSHGNEIRDFGHGYAIPRQDRILESMEIFSNEINMRLSQEMDAMLSMMHSHISRAISSAIPKIGNSRQSIMSPMPFNVEEDRRNNWV